MTYGPGDVHDRRVSDVMTHAKTSKKKTPEGLDSKPGEYYIYYALALNSFSFLI